MGLVGLKLGRPLFYTDGEREVLGAELADAPMLVWDRPEPDVEIPGPVRGRVQTLPDGRLLYGRLTPAGSTDLVLFDPARSTLPPERVVALNSRGHDLAPALAADGTLYFSSDRRGGVGGFDLYRARYRGGSFGDVERLPAWINSAFDETDPAPDPGGDRVVFVRRDPDVRSGQNGVIMIGRLEVDEAAVPLYSATRQPAPLDRDPAFAPDGVSLWFVRQTLDEPPVIMRAWRMGDQFAPPITMDSLRPGGPYRAPEPDVEGLSVRLLQPGTSAEPGTRALVYRSRAREVFPWWAGQAGLELLLFGLAVFFATLLLLLLLGRIWRQLDVITWCLLLSLFVHLLVLLWLTDVEIVRRFMPSAPPEGRLSVELVSGTQAAKGSGLEVAQATREAHAEVQFASQARELDAGAPGAEMQETQRRAADAGAWQPQALPEAASTPVEVGVADEVAELSVREGQDARVELAEVAVSTAQADAASPRAETPGAPIVTRESRSAGGGPGGGRASVADKNGSGRAGSPARRCQPRADDRGADAGRRQRARAGASTRHRAGGAGPAADPRSCYHRQSRGVGPARARAELAGAAAGRDARRQLADRARFGDPATIGLADRVDAGRAGAGGGGPAARRPAGGSAPFFDERPRCAAGGCAGGGGDPAGGGVGLAALDGEARAQCRRGGSERGHAALDPSAGAAAGRGDAVAGVAVRGGGSTPRAAGRRRAARRDDRPGACRERRSRAVAGRGHDRPGGRPAPSRTQALRSRADVAAAVRRRGAAEFRPRARAVGDRRRDGSRRYRRRASPCKGRRYLWSPCAIARPRAAPCPTYPRRAGGGRLPRWLNTIGDRDLLEGPARIDDRATLELEKLEAEAPTRTRERLSLLGLATLLGACALSAVALALRRVRVPGLGAFAGLVAVYALGFALDTQLAYEAGLKTLFARRLLLAADAAVSPLFLVFVARLYRHRLARPGRAAVVAGAAVTAIPLLDASAPAVHANGQTFAEVAAQRAPALGPDEVTSPNDLPAKHPETQP